MSIKIITISDAFCMDPDPDTAFESLVNPDSVTNPVPNPEGVSLVHSQIKSYENKDTTVWFDGFLMPSYGC